MFTTMKKIGAALLALMLVCTLAVSALAMPADGTYEGVGQGIGGDVKVSVTVKDGKIADVAVLSHSETAGISDPAIAQIPAAIVAANSTEVDGVAGATITSGAIKTAVANALSGVVAEEVAEVVLPYEQADVIVVGGGLGGMAATVRASELGANVLLIEQTGRLGGSGLLAGGSLVGVNTRMEAENGIEDSVELMMEDFVRLGGEGMFNPVLAKTFAENCGRAVDWLDTYVGVNFGERKPTTGGYVALNVPRVHYSVPEDGNVERSSAKGASGYVKALREKIEAGIANGNV